MNIRILKCTCNHPYQDKKYGYKKRAHNIRSSNDRARKGDARNVTGWRCTVCGRER